MNITSRISISCSSPQAAANQAIEVVIYYGSKQGRIQRGGRGARAPYPHGSNGTPQDFSTMNEEEEEEKKDEEEEKVRREGGGKINPLILRF